MARQQLLHLEMRDGLPRRVRVERVPQCVVAIAADRRVDHAGSRARSSDHEREVFTRHCARLDELLQPAVRLRRARDHEQARRVAIEAMDDPRTVRLLPAFDVVREQSVHERPARMSRRRMHDDAGALVDDEQVLVLVRNAQVHVLGSEIARRRHGRLELELLAAGERRALRPHAAVDQHAALAQQSFRDSA